MNAAIANPPQGTYVDNGFVEQSEVVDGTFDFFLVPHSVTQGAVKPTHFYVASNTSQISKDAILNFTYALCYNYYNWADSIKIPAPCMLADKIAIYRSEIGNIPSNMDLHKLPFFLWRGCGVHYTGWETKTLQRITTTKR
jgi:aubergine-like protein